jgi:hypothetical protein
MTTHDDLLTVPEVARLLAMTEGGVRVMISRNRLKPTIWQGDEGARRHLFSRASVEDYRRLYSRFRPRQCAHCHTPITVQGNYQQNRMYCDDNCQAEADRRLAKGLPPDYVEPIAVAPPGPTGYRRPLRILAECEHCGAEFAAVSVTHRYCSTTCRVHAFFERHDIDRAMYCNHGLERVGKATS